MNETILDGERKLAYKVLRGTKACNGGEFDYEGYLPRDGNPGEWLPEIQGVQICRVGYHLTLAPHQWRGNRVFLCEYTNGIIGDNKIVCPTFHFINEITLENCIDVSIYVRIADLRGIDLSNEDLYGANLRGADLGGANLRGANLGGADLGGANLRGAYLHEADLSNTDLYGAILDEADLSWTNLHGANLSGANLYGANLKGTNLHGANLYGANLHRANLRGADLRWANLHEANLKGTNMEGTGMETQVK